MTVKMAARKEEMCSICNRKFKFQAKRKKFEKVSLEAKLERQDSALKDVFSAVGIQITPVLNRLKKYAKIRFINRIVRSCEQMFCEKNIQIKTQVTNSNRDFY